MGLLTDMEISQLQNQVEEMQDRLENMEDCFYNLLDILNGYAEELNDATLISDLQAVISDFDKIKR